MAPKVTSNKKADKPVITSQKGRSASSKTSGVQKAKPKHRRQSDDGMITVGGPSNPIVIRKPSSYTSRKKKRAHCSMKSFFEEPMSKYDKPVDYASTFEPGSSAEYTWGIATSQPVRVIEAKRRHAGFRAFGLRRGRKSAFEKFMFGKQSEEIVPFRFMDLPLEIRREVYGHLLVRPRAIIMESDWRKVLITGTHDHTILLVSKQVSLESTQVLLGQNFFQTYIGYQNKFSSFKTGLLAQRLVSNFKNVIIECQRTIRMSVLAGQMASCVHALVRSGTVLNSLTIAISPFAAIWDPTSPIQWPTYIQDNMTFADFFEAPTSKLMRVLPKLQCKILNIVIRLPDNRRALVSIDLRANPINEGQNGWLSENEMSKLTAARNLAKLKKNLNGLKERIEDICVDHQKATLEGKARLLGRDEDLIDGMRLAARGIKIVHRGTAEIAKVSSLPAAE